MKPKVEYPHFAIDHEGVKHHASKNVGYLLISNGKIEIEYGAALADFKLEDAKTSKGRARQATLHMKSKVGCHVYYKAGSEWQLIGKHFAHLRDTFAWWNMPFIVIVEYK